MNSQAFWDRHAPKYAKKPIADLTAYEEKLTRVRSLAREKDRVLEIGCGTGGTALRIAPSVAHVTATDISGEMIRIARSKLGANARNDIAFHKVDAAQVVQGHPFDMICAFSLLHLVGDISQVLDSVHRQLKPGGLFLSKTAYLKDRSRLIQAIVRVLAALGLAPQVTLLSQRELIEYLNRAGFDIDQSMYFGTGRMSPFIVARRPAD